MASLVKLAVVTKSGEQASFLQNLACLSSSSVHVVEKQPYFVSTSSYQLFVNAFYCSHVPNSNGAYKNHVRQNGSWL